MSYAKFTKKDNSSMITYVGNFCKTADTLVLDNIELVALDELMRLQSAAMRTSYNDITKRHLQRKDSTDKNKDLFINNARYMRDAFSMAEQGIASQKALLPEYLENKISVLSNIEKKLARLEKAKKAKFKKERILKGKAKIKKLKKEIAFYSNHIENDTCPPCVFGGKSNVKLLKLGKITKSEWILSRRKMLYAVGEKSKGGNENIRLTHLHDDMFSVKVLNPLDDKKGARLSFVVKFPKKMVNDIKSYLATGEAYTIKIIKESDGYSLHLTMSALTPLDDALFKLGVAGIDINPDNISVSIIDDIGNFRYSKIFKFPDINYVSSGRRDFIVGNKVKHVINYIKSFGIKIVVIEDLKFRNNFQNDSNLNRLLSNFVHSKIVNNFGSRCFKDDMILKKVNPAYTSLLGRIKYQKRFGLSVHEAAALCIARKGLGLKEKLPKKILTDFFAMEVKDKVKFSDNKRKEQFKDLYAFFMNYKFRKEIYSLDKFQLEVLKTPRMPREWLFEDYLKYGEFYIFKLLKNIMQMQYSFNI